MTNSEKYKTAEERADAFNKWCYSQECVKCPIQNGCRETNDGSFYWLDLEAEDDDKMLPCPCCHGSSNLSLTKNSSSDLSLTKNLIGLYQVGCACGYRSSAHTTKKEALEYHNRLANAVIEMERIG